MKYFLVKYEEVVGSAIARSAAYAECVCVVHTGAHVTILMSIFFLKIFVLNNTTPSKHS